MIDDSPSIRPRVISSEILFKIHMSSSPHHGGQRGEDRATTISGLGEMDDLEGRGGDDWGGGREEARENWGDEEGVDWQGSALKVAVDHGECVSSYYEDRTGGRGG